LAVVLGERGVVLMQTKANMSAQPFFYKEPLRYLRWASINKPAYFFSICVGLAGPGIIAVAVPTRKYLGYERIAKVPQTYPSTCARA
jgi:hypothetical protein